MDNQVNLSINEHRVTNKELNKLEEQFGVFENGTNYNEIIQGHGTGLQPPTTEEWNSLSQNSFIIDTVSYPTVPLSVDNSQTQYFPPIGDQGSQGSCVAWAVGYYTKSFQEAKEHGWNSAEGGSDKIMSPSFIYNLINNGNDEGSYVGDAIDLVCSLGDCSLAKMPYNESDYTSWPSESAWEEASLYRGNESTDSFLEVQTDNGINNLKNWLASGNLAIISVDANKIQDQTWGGSLLTDQDMLTLDNYQNVSTNHAVAIVGYDDEIAYSELGQTHYGAFKIANSWGISTLPSPFSWEHKLDGCFWISYEAMIQQVRYCHILRDLINYEPKILAKFSVNDSVRSNCEVTIGLGNPINPIATKRFNDYVFGGSHPFCSNNIVIDITEFSNYVPSLYNQSLFLKVYDSNQYEANGTVNYFAVDNFTAPGTPCRTIKMHNVFLTLIYNPTTTSNITLVQEGISSPISNDNTFQVSYYLGNESHLAFIKNGQTLLTVDNASKLEISGISTGSTFTEKWVLNVLQKPVTISAGNETTLYYYHLLNQSVGYLSTNTSFSSPDLLYYTAPLTTSSQPGQSTISSLTLPLFFQQNIWVLRGTELSVRNNIPGADNDRWTTPVQSWNITEANQIDTNIFYYHQYQVNASYITDGSMLVPRPLLFGTQFGSSFEMKLEPTNSITWLDENTPWSISANVISFSGTERWLSSDISGYVTEAKTIVQPYVHQFYLTVTSPYSKTSGSGWYNSTNIAQAIIESLEVSENAGSQHTFSGWTGDASGSGQISDSIIMDSPKLAIAIWTTKYLINLVNTQTEAGSIYPSGDNLWINSGNLYVSSTPKSGYSFSKWTTDTDAISFSEPNASSTVVNINGPGTITAVWIANPTSPSTEPQGTNPTSQPTSNPSPSKISTPTQNPIVTPSPTTTIPELSIFAVMLLIAIATVPLITFKKKLPPIC